MNKQEYLNALRQRLGSYPPAFIDEITDAFEEHFLEGESKGLSEAEVIESLGTVDEVAENIRMMNNEQYNERPAVQIETAIRKASGMINDGITALRENSQNNMLKDMLELEGSFEIIDIEARHSVDVQLFPADSLSFRFVPVRHMLFGANAELFTRGEGDTAVFEVPEGNGKLDISVPPGVRVIHAVSGSGDIYARNLNLDELNAESRSGDIKIYASENRLLNVSTVSGDIRFENGSCSAMKLTSVSGDIDVKRSSGDAECSSVSGDIDIKQHDGRQISAHAVSGDLEIHSNALQISTETLSGDIDLDLLGHFDTVTAASKSGDISCRPYHSDYTGSLRSASGSVKIKADITVAEKDKRSAWVGNGSGRLELVSRSGDVRLN